MKKITFLILLLWLGNKCFAQDTITAFQAKDYVEKTCILKGKVCNVKIINNDKGGVAFIHFEKPYPDTPFKVVIFGKQFDKFPKDLEAAYTHKTIQITAKITHDRNGKPQVIINQPDEMIVLE
jgi:hypothetical protein